MLLGSHNNKPNARHPYFEGNFAPIHRTLPLTPCSYEGELPAELAGGQYVRNGGNPLKNEDLGREAHWFDGDGMLSGVLFRRMDKLQSGAGSDIVPEFVNQYLLTDAYRYHRASTFLRRPLVFSFTLFMDPLRSVLAVFATILRTVVLLLLSWLPGSASGAIKRFSTANTALVYHDGRALTTCESGPPLRVLLPGLETVGWFNGRHAENEPGIDSRPGFGSGGPLNLITEWTTSHPRIDPSTGEFISYHAIFFPPYVRYSVIPATQQQPPPAPMPTKERASSPRSPIFNAPIPGVSGAKMMHAVGVSQRHTVTIDLPLWLDPKRLLRGRVPIEYDAAGRARFGVFPRHHPERLRWFETSACCIFHTANTWETVEKVPVAAASLLGGTEQDVVHMLACRMTSATVMYGAGNLRVPDSARPAQGADEQCRLYYYQFPLPRAPGPANHIRHQWALSAIPFDFPSVRRDVEMSEARYIYGCSTSSANFGAALGRAVKIDALAKIDTTALIRRGLERPPAQVDGCVDMRSVRQIHRSIDPDDAIKVFVLPAGWYAQEPRFVPRQHGVSEDDGWLLSYVFDERAGLDPRTGACRDGARSELWIVDAGNMRDVVGRVTLPQRVPYGLHGNWFDEGMIRGQRPVAGVRRLVEVEAEAEAEGEKGVATDAGPWTWRVWMQSRNAIERALG